MNSDKKHLGTFNPIRPLEATHLPQYISPSSSIVLKPRPCQVNGHWDLLLVNNLRKLQNVIISFVQI